MEQTWLCKPACNNSSFLTVVLVKGFPGSCGTWARCSHISSLEEFQGNIPPYVTIRSTWSSRTSSSHPSGGSRGRAPCEEKDWVQNWSPAISRGRIRIGITSTLDKVLEQCEVLVGQGEDGHDVGPGPKSDISRAHLSQTRRIGGPRSWWAPPPPSVPPQRGRGRGTL